MLTLSSGAVNIVFLTITVIQLHLLFTADYSAELVILVGKVATRLREA